MGRVELARRDSQAQSDPVSLGPPPPSESRVIGKPACRNSAILSARLQRWERTRSADAYLGM